MNEQMIRPDCQSRAGALSGQLSGILAPFNGLASLRAVCCPFLYNSALNSTPTKFLSTL
jgi:hypothetical protein